MRPYFSVIVDSFREALASKVLWILLLLSTLFLGGLAPISFQGEQASQLRTTDVRDWDVWLARLVQGADAEEDSTGKYLWSLFDDQTRQQIRDEVAGGDQSPRDTYRVYSDVVDALNPLLARRDFYNAAAWKGVTFGNRTNDLLSQGVENLSAEDVVLLNRLLLADAFRQQLAPVPDEVIFIAYAGYRLGGALPVDRGIANTVVKTGVGVFMEYFVGVFGVLVAILVTASMVPRMFEPGVIDLLLSKPVSRSLLFLSKFVGGCMFILLNAAYFIFGLWLIMGFRFGVWSGPLLLCIPLFMFLFSIHYSVSALAGMYWKNAIVAIIITILFWVMCFAVGQTKGVMEQFLIAPDRIVKLASTNHGVIAVNQASALSTWDPAADVWRPLSELQVGPGGPVAAGPLVVGPVYDEEADRLLLIAQPQSLGGFGAFGQRSRLISAIWSGDWRKETELTPPPGSSWLFRDDHGATILVAATGLYRIDPEKLSAYKEQSVLGVAVPAGESPFVPIPVTPALNLSVPFAASMNSDGDLAVFNDIDLARYHRQQDGSYAEAAKREMADVKAPVVLDYGVDVLLAAADGQVSILKAADLSTERTASPAGVAEPYAAVERGSFKAVLFHNGQLWIFKQNKSDAEWKRVGRDVSAFELEGTKLWTAEHGVRAVVRDSTSLQTDEELSPRRDLVLKAYYYFILPCYTIFPKPGGLDNVVQYLLTERDSTPVSASPNADPRETRLKVDIVGPVVSNVSFVVVMLGISCFLFHRADL